jgi:gliding motility-associated-like protein
MVKNFGSCLIFQLLIPVFTLTHSFPLFAEFTDTSVVAQAIVDKSYALTLCEKKINAPYIFNNSADLYALSTNFSNNILNAAPVAVNDFQDIDEDNIATGSVATNDSDPDNLPSELTYTQIGSVSAGVFVLKTNGTYTFTPNVNYNGIVSVNYNVCDPGGLCSTATLTITVKSINDAPIGGVDVVTIPEDTPSTGTVITNDEDADNAKSTLTYKRIGTIVWNFTLNTQGTYSFVPPLNFNGIIAFTYEVCDPVGLCDTSSLIFIIEPVNDAPVAQDFNLNTTEDSPITGTLTSRVSDVDNSVTELTISLVDITPNSGSFTILPNNSYTFVPHPNFTGTATVRYRVCDPLGLCDTGIIQITVTPVNDPPVAMDDVISVNEDNTLNSTVASNDIDVDNTPNTLTYSPLGTPTEGVFTMNPNGTFTFTPNTNFTGTVKIDYRVCDSSGLCDTAVLTIVVKSVNDSPVVITSPISTQEDTEKDVCFPIVDVDSGDTLNISVCKAPVNGSAMVRISNNQACLTYTPNLNFNGNDSICIKICDSSGGCTEKTIPITVTPVNDPPVVVVTPITTNEDNTTTVCLDINDVDGGDTFTSSTCGGMNGQSSAAVQNGKVCLTYTPNADFNGQDSVCIKVCDQTGTCVEVSVPITVTPVNDTPSVVVIPVTTAEDSIITACFKILDKDGTDTYTATSCNGASSKITTTTDKDELCVTYKPDTDFNGKDSVCIKVCDKAGACVFVNIPITVTPVNDTPIVVVKPVIVNSDYSVTQCFDIIDKDGLDKYTASICDKGKGDATIDVHADKVCITYKAPNTSASTDSICIQVCDSSGACKKVIIPITINICTDTSPISMTCPQAVEVNMAGEILTDPNKFIVSSTVSDDCHGNILVFKNPIASHPCGDLNSIQIEGLKSGYTFNEGTHRLIFEAKNRTGQVSVCSTSVTVKPISLANIKNLEMCLNEPISVKAQKYSTGAYKWEKNKQVVSSSHVLFDKMATDSETGQYMLYATFGNCVMKDTVNVKINTAPKTEDDDFFTAAEDTLRRSVVLNDNILSDANPVITLKTNTSSLKGSLSFNNDGTFIFKPKTGFSGIETFEYEVCYEDCPNICSKSTARIEIIPHYRPTNIITPNGDNDNETFKIKGYDPSLPGNEQSEITIYNQWGNVVYQTKGYQNDWKGYYKGEPLPAGTYYFFFRKNPNTTPLKGFVSILR